MRPGDHREREWRPHLPIRKPGRMEGGRRDRETDSWRQQAGKFHNHKRSRKQRTNAATRKRRIFTKTQVSICKDGGRPRGSSRRKGLCARGKAAAAAAETRAWLLRWRRNSPGTQPWGSQTSQHPLFQRTRSRFRPDHCHRFAGRVHFATPLLQTEQLRHDTCHRSPREIKSRGHQVFVAWPQTYPGCWPKS